MAGVVIAGSGALGSFYGGLLTTSGVDVLLLARGKHAEVMKENGLELQLPTRTLTVSVEVADEASGDILILTSKLSDTYEVLRHVHTQPRIAISLQNGPAKSDALRDQFGADVVVGGASTITVELVGPGVVTCRNLGSTYVGPASSSAQELHDVFEHAGLDSHVIDDIQSLEWSKLAYAASLMLVQVLSRRPAHDIFLDEDAASLFKELIDEIAGIAEQEGIALGDWPNLPPVGSIANSEHSEALALLRLGGERLQQAGSTSLFSSMYQSLDQGKRTELQEIHGELVRRASRHGLRVPALETCYRLARLAGA